MNYCRQVSLNGVMAALFGALALVFLAVEVALFVIGDTVNFLFGHAALLCGLTSTTLWVRGYFLAARDREMKCFETGREVGRVESSGVRDLHAIS